MANVSISAPNSGWLPERYDYDYLMIEMWDRHGDPRTNRYFPGGPAWLFGVVGAYLFFVYYLGPWFMRNRKPYELRKAMIIYNFVNVLLSTMWFIKALHFTRGGIDTWGCKDAAGKDYSDFERAAWCWAYLAMKIFDLLDTVFFVLRKKQNQITPLHVSHHAIMPFTVYMASKFIPTTQTIHTLLVNSFVHILMYTFYGLSAAGEQYRKYLWWKKYITTIQLVQFALIIIHASHLLFNPNCDYPRIVSGLELAEGLYFFYFFGKFYIRTYKKERNNNLNAHGKKVD